MEVDRVDVPAEDAVGAPALDYAYRLIEVGRRDVGDLLINAARAGLRGLTSRVEPDRDRMLRHFAELAGPRKRGLASSLRVHVGYTRDRGVSESKLYFGVVWTMIVVGSAILLAGFDQPLVLVTISTVMGGAIMFVYTCLLLVTKRRYLPAAIQLRGYRAGILVFAVAMLGVTTAIVAVDQVGNLF